MNYDTYSYVSLRICSLEIFTEYINQETNVGRLAIIGGTIIEDIDPRRLFVDEYYSRFLQVDKALTINDGNTRLEIIKHRRQYLINLREKHSPLIEREIIRGTSSSVRKLIQELELKDKQENKLGGITQIKSKLEIGESSNSNRNNI